MAGEEAFAGREELPPPRRQRALSLEQAAPSLRSEQVTQVVPDYRRRGGYRDHGGDLQLPPLRQHSSGHQSRLSRKRESQGLEADERPERDVSEVGGKLEEGHVAVVLSRTAAGPHASRRPHLGGSPRRHGSPPDRLGASCATAGVARANGAAVGRAAAPLAPPGSIGPEHPG
jgi:hypothetical protein